VIVIRSEPNQRVLGGLADSLSSLQAAAVGEPSPSIVESAPRLKCVVPQVVLVLRHGTSHTPCPTVHT
jgi:hypothetical protein